MPERAFTLKDDVAENFAGGSMAYGPESKTLDFAAALEEGGGIIKATDPGVIDALAHNPAFKPVSVASADEAREEEGVAPEDGLDDQTSKELLTLAEKEGVEDVTSRSTKAELLSAIRAERASEES